MKITPIGLEGAFLVEQEPHVDTRGFFARAYCRDTFRQAGIDYDFPQANMSGCNAAGTLRGLHYQDERAPEAKLLRCIRGSVYDVMVDMRADSPTYLRWYGVELTADNRRAVLVPPMFAHGYLALSDDAEVYYQVSHPYQPGTERGVRFDDPTLKIDWPHPVLHVSDKDRAWPDLALAAPATVEDV